MKNDIINLIAQEANCPPSSILTNNTLEEDLGLDSLNMASLQMAVEDEIESPIDDEAWFACHTVQDIIGLAGKQIATH